FGSLDTFSLPKDVPVQVWDVGPAPVANVAVMDVRPASLMVRAEQSTTIQATILNSRGEPLDQRPVSLKLTNKSKSIALPGVASASPGATTTVTFETPSLSPGLWQGTVSIAGDDGLPLDDSRHVAVFAAARPRVLLLDGAARDVAALGEAYFLEAALRLATSGRTAPRGAVNVVVFPYRPGPRLPALPGVGLPLAAPVR